MIRWCAYCQSYMGEAEPLDRYAMTHGICKKCGDSDVVENPVSAQRLQPLVEFFSSLREKARAGLVASTADLPRAAFRLGIQPQDLLIGMVQPALYEIGELWARGEVTIAAEHKFSAFADSLVGALYAHYPELDLRRQAPSPDILLVNAEGNYHTLGIKFLETSLLAAGLKTYTVLPGLPSGEIMALVKALKPGTVGLSVSMQSQGPAAAAVAQSLLELPLPDRPGLLVGGLPVKKDLPLPPVLSPFLCKNFLEIPVERLRSKR
jgi:methanogenic corrinoid protein MtbC1